MTTPQNNEDWGECSGCGAKLKLGEEVEMLCEECFIERALTHEYLDRQGFEEEYP